MAVVRFVPENRHWRLEYPVGKVLLDSINWISTPKISPDGKWVAFADHENTSGRRLGIGGGDRSGRAREEACLGMDLAGGNCVVAQGRRESGLRRRQRQRGKSARGESVGQGEDDCQRAGRDVAARYSEWSGADDYASDPAGNSGHGAGGERGAGVGLAGMGGTGDVSRDGRKVLFEEEGDGGGPNYTVFLRDMDGSPPVRIGEGVAQAISPDGKWVITKPAKEGPLSIVPTGAGEARQLTHDSISYDRVRYLPDGKRLLAWGIEPGHGERDYLIDVASGDFEADYAGRELRARLFPRTGAGRRCSGPDGKWGVWPLEGGGIAADSGTRWEVGGDGVVAGREVALCEREPQAGENANACIEWMWQPEKWNSGRRLEQNWDLGAGVPARSATFRVMGALTPICTSRTLRWHMWCGD